MIDHHTVPQRTREALRVALGPRREGLALSDTAVPSGFDPVTETLFAGGRFQEYLVEWPQLGGDRDLERDYLGYQPMDGPDLEDAACTVCLYRRAQSRVAGRDYPRFLAELRLGEALDRVWLPSAVDVLRFLAEIAPITDGAISTYLAEIAEDLDEAYSRHGAGLCRYPREAGRGCFWCRLEAALREQEVTRDTGLAINAPEACL